MQGLVERQSPYDREAERIEPGLAALQARVAHDLACLNYPPANWVPETRAPDGTRALDVLIVGAGMCGITASFALLREGVRHLRCIDRAAEGLEGPWTTTARMPTLRSPKHLTGPDLGVPTLTYRAWHEARFGAGGWDQLYKIDRVEWAAYLRWVRRQVGVPVENGVELLELDASAPLLRVVLGSARGREAIHVRKLVLATGRDGAGGFRWPAFPSFDRADSRRAGRVMHTLEEIDFAALRGKRIAMLGVLATAVDNAATALEAGAREVVCFARRPHLPQVNKSKGASFPGFQRGIGALDPATRWRLQTYMLTINAPPPHESVLRCQKLKGFSFRFDEPWLDLALDGEGVLVTTPRGPQRFDAALLGTGFEIDIAERPELAPVAGQVRRWRDLVPASEAARHPDLASQPALGPGFELVGASASAPQGLGGVHLFNWGSAMSHGPLAGDIPGLLVGATRLSNAIVQDLFTTDFARHEAAVHAHEDPELAPTDYFVPRDKRSGPL
ncbi:MAG: NAD(P)/FAD-dependent oxidoreductase [Alphaproteobacteria bacterium]|nr:NAD(P)/FAD-dependent oxidoreductase [Alphaproteobacteria bacterium]